MLMLRLMFFGVMLFDYLQWHTKDFENQISSAFCHFFWLFSVPWNFSFPQAYGPWDAIIYALMNDTIFCCFVFVTGSIGCLYISSCWSPGCFICSLGCLSAALLSFCSIWQLCSDK